MGRFLLRVALYAPYHHAGFAAAAVLGTVTALWIPAALADALTLSDTGARVLLGVLLAADVAATVLAGFTKNSAVARCTARLRKELAQRLLAAGPEATRRYSAGDLAGRFVAAAEGTADACFTTVTLLVGAATSLGALAALLLMDGWLALVFAVAIPLTVREMRRTGAAASHHHTRYQQEQSTLTGRLSAALTGLRSIRATGTQQAEAARILAPLPALTAAGRATWRVEGAAGRRAGLLQAAVLVAVMSVVTWDVAAGRLAPPDMLTAAGYTALALRITDQVSTSAYLGYIQASARRVRGVLDLPPRPPSRAAAPARSGDLVFHRVHVRDDHDEALLDGLELTVPAGRSLAVVGAAGPALDAVAALAAGLLAPHGGSVRVGGEPVRAGDVGYAFARPVLFGTTLRDALVAGRPEASDAEVERALRTAGAAGFVHRLPHGCGTPLDALPLSGGERQRLGLTRTLVHDRPVAVLDDATSSLDTVTEAQVGRALDASMRGRTRLIVAHRAATAARAELVAWLDGGRLRALGTHRQLCRLPEYRALFTTRSTADERAGR
ncbi:ABC transporter ATP-binding protein [Streptomyces sp. NPDC047071]|uniref:ABC transporter ATP-binding protein n=1 Tax=Streptomyces sp. NPDC047071 TaxID=3154808 RepID=UPI00345591D4